MRPAIVLAALSCAVAALPAQAQRRDWNVYPAMRQTGVIYTVRTDDAGKIVRCDPANAAPPPAQVAEACAALAIKGIPATVVPARSVSDPARWVMASDYPVDASGTGALVQLMFEVDEAGRIADCRPYPVSANPPFEAAACAALIARARFSAAAYKGQPVRAAGVQTVQFAPR